MIKIDVKETTPVVSLARALPIAAAVLARGPLSRDQIAGALGAKPATGSANNRVIAARKFGLVTRERGGQYAITALGRRLAIPDPSPEDVMAAVRKVPVFKFVLAAHSGGIADVADAVLEKEAVAAGATAIEAPRIIRLLRTSMTLVNAENDADADAVAGVPNPVPPVTLPAKTSEPEPNAEHSAAASGLATHPLIIALLGAAPAPESPWNDVARADWMKAFDAVLTVIYGSARP